MESETELLTERLMSCPWVAAIHVGPGSLLTLAAMLGGLFLGGKVNSGSSSFDNQISSLASSWQAGPEDPLCFRISRCRVSFCTLNWKKCEKHLLKLRPHHCYLPKLTARSSEWTIFSPLWSTVMRQSFNYHPSSKFPLELFHKR